MTVIFIPFLCRRQSTNPMLWTMYQTVAYKAVVVYSYVQLTTAMVVETRFPHAGVSDVNP